MLQRPIVAQVAARARGLASPAVATTKAAAPDVVDASDQEVKTSRCSNGLLVSTVDRHHALSRVAFAFRAGSRYETPATLGAAHRLRNCVGTVSSRGHSAYELLWRAGLLGSDVSVYTTRDLFVVNIAAYRDYAMPAMEVLGEMACRPAMKNHELFDSHEQLKTERELMKVNLGARAFELLHKAAFRNGALGHSLVTPSYMIGRHDERMMEQFVSEHLLSGEACVVGVNVDHGQLLAYAQGQSCPVVDGKALPLPASPYLGGEARKDVGGPLAHVLLGGRCDGLDNAHGGAVAAVYAALLSAGPVVKYSTACGAGLVSQAVSAALPNHPYGVTSFHTMHADHGLTGVYCVSETANAAAAVGAAAKAMHRLAANGCSADELKRAKSVAAVSALLRAEEHSLLIEDLATQTLAGTAVHSDAETVWKAVDAVQQTDIATLAKSIMAKPSMAAVGNLSATPYLDELRS